MFGWLNHIKLQLFNFIDFMPFYFHNCWYIPTIFPLYSYYIPIIGDGIIFHIPINIPL